MSAAGTPSTDPWVILSRERARYEEQFKSLKPNGGVVTGEQAKGFFLQSQLPPLVLGQIWALADTDSDGKMDINEFSIACKLINLKLRGFDIPKMLPPSLVASLRPIQPPAIPPLPNPALMSQPPARPEPPKGPAPVVSSAPVGTVAPMGGVPVIPTGVVPPMPSSIPPIQQPLIGGIPPLTTAPPPITTQPLGAQMMTNQPINFGTPLVPGIPPSTGPLQTTMGLTSAAPLVSNIAPTGVPLVSGAPIAPIVAPISATPVPSQMSPIGAAVPPIPSAPAATSTPRGSMASVASLDRAGSIESVPQVDWAVPHQTKLKYTQIFNTTDRTRSGYLSGAQARNVMVQTKLPQNLLAQIWALSDMDADGRLGSEEFVLAMHLCEQAAMGTPPPSKLPPDLVPPSFRRTTRTASVSSQGSVVPEQDPASTLLQTTFEDKRKENYEKGQAELERRRKTLLDQQRKEREEQERKEREELERRERARQEAERKRLEELEKQMREQQEKERLLEEERKRQAEQRESARKEMERQRQLEWEKQRLQELQQQRQREQENVLKLKAKNQSLTIELSTLNEQVKELSQKICDTRVGVSNVKSTIDGMRSTRDSQMAEMSQLKNRLKDQNAKLLALSQEKAKLEAKNKLNTQSTGRDSEQARLAFENKEITIKNLKEKVADMQTEIDGKTSDITNNNAQLTELRTQMRALVDECENLYVTYERKRDKVMEMKTKPVDFDGAWKSETSAWGETDAASEWPGDDWGGSGPTAPATAAIETESIPGLHKYKAIYEFVARNGDEISFQPGDIINVPEQQTGEPGWLAGEIRGHTGWFPEAYVEPLDGIGISGATETVTTPSFADIESTVLESEKLEEITEVPETTNDVVTEQITAPVAAAPVAELEGEPEYFIASYPYQSQEPGDLTFNAGDVIAVYKKDGDWWTGKLGDNSGIFPSNYVQKVDVSSTAVPAAIPTNDEVASDAIASVASIGVSAEAVKSALESAQMDNEVSQITEAKTQKTPTEKDPPNAAQVTKGKKPEIASVIAPYQATSPEQLSLARGQLIMIRKKTDSGWWEGELQAKGRKRQVGWFPASYVKVLNSSGKISGRTTPVSTTRMQQEVVIDKVVALYPYTAGNPDELSFAKDDIISVTAREEEAWWRGELNGVSGVFPSNYVTTLQPQSISANDKRRQGCVNELIQTEQAYVQDMSTVHEVFEIPLRKSKIIPVKDIDEIFVNWQDILQVNKSFLNDLMNAYNSGSETIGLIICKHLPLMTAYITFCGKQLDSATLLQKLTETSTAFRELVRKCQNNVATKGMPLSSFLIKPMQRITRYPLLISKILENTPTDHPEYKNLEEAHRMAVKFLSCVNENVRLREDEERMSWLQQCVQNELNLVFNSNTNKLGPRQLLHHGMLTKLKNGKELLGFLFNDFFMLVQPSKSTQFSFQRNSNVTYKMYKQPILIQNLSLSRESSENVEQGTDSNRVLKLQDDKSGYKISLLASTVHECTMWSKKIEHAKEMYTKIDNLNRQNKRKTLLPAGKCLVVAILQASELQIVCNAQTCRLGRKKGKAHTENVYCKVTLGTQEQLTDIAKDCPSNGNSPQNGAPAISTLVWNHSMQFQLRNVKEESLTFTVLEQNPYSPDEFLGKAELKLKDIYSESQNRNGPLTKKLILHQVASGEIIVKLDLHMFNNY